MASLLLIGIAGLAIVKAANMICEAMQLRSERLSRKAR